MKKLQTSSKSTINGEAVPVSFRLQFSVVAAALVTWAFQLVYTVMTYAPWNNSSLSAYSFVAIATVLFPLVVFGVVLLGTARHKQPISSLFIAVLKTLLALFMLAVLIGLKNWIVRLTLDPGIALDEGLRWITSPGVDVGIMALTLFSVLWIQREQSRK